MRIVPVGLFYHDAPDLYARACTSAVVTHTHPVGQDGAAVLARAVAEAVTLDPHGPFPRERFLQRLVAEAQTGEVRGKLALIKTLLGEQLSSEAAARRLGQGVAVHESMPFALYAFLRHPTSFEACLYCAILNGGDRDTLGAMAGAVSGAYLGLEAIPPVWQEKLENRHHLETLALKLLEMRS
jgi:poly(ADP-ribose) glycohydrolase ARH3